jgi:D-aminopeptidase
MRRETFIHDHSPVMDLLFQAAAESTEEAIMNAVFKAETVCGRDGNQREALPLDAVRDVLQRYGRLD